MPLPLRHLPVIQNWDCHVCGNCCKEYVVALSPEEKQRIEAQGWEKDPVLTGLPLFYKVGPWYRRRYALTSHSDGTCIFLSAEGRCRIHEKFGYEAKPLPCRMFPFVMVPAGDHWRVGMRYSCPSAAANKGRLPAEHAETLRSFAAELTIREKLGNDSGQPVMRPPRMQGGQRMAWDDVLRVVQALSNILRNRKDRFEHRMRKCLALANICRQAKFDEVKGKRLDEFLSILTTSLDGEAPANLPATTQPKWLGRILFRQAVAFFTRKDQGPDSGIAREGRLALLRAAWRFVVGSGPVPRLHKKLPSATFEQIEATSSVLIPEAEETLERYYLVKTESLQFFGATNFNLSFWEGFEMLALTMPIILWVSRSYADISREEAVQRALTIVDDHFGFNPLLQTQRQRIGYRILARTGELSKLIAWYSR